MVVATDRLLPARCHNHPAASGARSYVDGALPRLAVVAQPGGEDVAAQRLLDERDGLRGRGEAAALGLVGGEHGVDGVRWQRLAQLGPGRAVAVSRALDAGLRVVPRHRRQRRRVPPQHAVQPVIGRHDVKQPGDRGRLEVLTARRMDSGWPARRYVRSHGRDHNTRSNDISTHIRLPYPLADDHPGILSRWLASFHGTWPERGQLADDALE